MNSGEPRNTKLNQSAGLRTSHRCEVRASASPTARKNPSDRATTPK